MRTATLYRYQIPLEAGVILREQRLKQREGIVVHLQEGAGEGWGEIAPLPGFSCESVDQAEEEAITQLTAWAKKSVLVTSQLPSVAFGLSCAEAELSDSLPQVGNYHAVPLCYGDPDELFDRLSALPGKKVAKVKVGLYEAVRDSLVVNTLLEALPDLYLRLDANRSWSLKKAESFAHYLAEGVRDRIDFIEEPCTTPEASLAFSAATGIPIAWDETLREPDFTLCAEKGVVAIVVKPTLMGSLAHCQQWIDQAERLGMRAVISAAIESSLGLTQLARVAQQLTPDSPPGLDTLTLLQQQLIRPWPGSPLPLITAEELEPVWQSS